MRIGVGFGRRDGGHPSLQKRTVGGAAGLAAAGAAAAAGKALLERRRREERTGREFRLHPDETVPDGVRRIARSQIDIALDALAGDQRDREAAVHEARKALKRLRTLLRLVRGDLDPGTYRDELDTFRDIGRELAVARDSQVAVETLEAVAERFSDELRNEDIEPLWERLDTEHRDAQERLVSDHAALGSAIAQLRSARARLPAWILNHNDFQALSPGLRRIYRRGRRATKTARTDPSTENLHELRKRVKDLWYTTQILRRVAPSRMRRMAHHVSDLLGEDHDLALLRTQALRHRREFVNRDALTALTAVIDRRRTQLRDEALAEAERLYSRKPRSFVQRIERRWRKRMPAGADSVAG
jgi:CHAD domain-containing protein